MSNSRRVTIEPESAEDEDVIRAVHVAAFPTQAEADLVSALRKNMDSQISLVAKAPEVIGHVMLSRMSVEGDGRAYRALGLGPVAVLPEHQARGVGSALIRKALRQAATLGNELVFVVGEPDYYGRFGFSADAAMPFASPYAGPYFMVRSLDARMPRLGTAAYAPAFAQLV